MVPILNHTDPVHIIPSYLSKIILDIVHPPTASITWKKNEKCQKMEITITGARLGTMSKATNDWASRTQEWENDIKIQKMCSFLSWPGTFLELLPR
jgi:hypothetical protein